MNDIKNTHQLKNIYFILRHGKSKANEEEIIVSDPVEGTTAYGLVREGREQARKGVEKALQEKLLDENTIIISSDFTRARETAEIAREVLKAQNVVLNPKLRERFFGLFEKTHNSNYEKVWADDKTFFNHKNNGVESTEEVLTRITSLMRELERSYAGKNILLVSHGDALQILQTAFENIPSSQHRTLKHLETGEVRKLTKK